jgi:transcriptional regulator GlxA family with amidase domain
MKTKAVLTALVVVLLVALTIAAATASAAPGPAPRNVAIVIYEGVEILDFAGPAEVLDAAGTFASPGGGTALNVYTVSKSTKPLKSQGFITILPEYSIENAPRPDLVVVPGGNSGSITNDPEFFAWVKGAAGKAEATLTVCTGAFVLAKAGYLDGKEITTWYGAIEKLRQQAPKAMVQPGRRFVDNGRFVTTAGVSAGIDGSLHLVARLFGRAVADQTARYMEYHWTPEPYLAKDYKLLNPSTDEEGRRLQLAELQRTAADAAPAAK